MTCGCVNEVHEWVHVIIVNTHVGTHVSMYIPTCEESTYSVSLIFNTDIYVCMCSSVIYACTI